ncbi:MAG: hypothetical protein ACFCVH_04200, partial [Alphaproteobacteria bacterium]
MSVRLAAATAALLATTALSVAAVAQDYVTWNDDGTVTLRADPEYNFEITVPQEKLGSLFAPDYKPFEGESVTVLTLDSG